MADGISGGSSDEEQLKQQQAAAAAKAVAAAKAETKAEAPVANPLLAPTPTLTQPVSGTNVLTSPYGTVTGTVPVQTVQTPYGLAAPAPKPNPFVAPQGALDANLATQQGQAAEAYRNLPDNATAQERASAMEAYRGALGTPAERSYEGVTGMREATIRADREKAGLSPEYTGPQDVAYYNQWIKNVRGINPYTIGTAEMTGRGGLNVLPIREEVGAQNMVSRMVKDVTDLREKADTARNPPKERGKERKEPNPQLADDFERQARALETESGLVNPRDPQAGYNVQNAKNQLIANQRLIRDTSSLSGLAQKDLTAARQRAPTEKETQKAQKAEPSEETRLEKLVAEDQERRRIAWEDEMRRRKFMPFLGGGNLAAAY